VSNDGQAGLSTHESMKIAPFANYDPLADYLHNRLRVSPLGFGALILILHAVLVVGLVWRHSLWWGRPGETGLLEDYTAVFTYLVYYPTVCYILLWSTRGSTRVFQRLIDARVFKSKRGLARAMQKRPCRIRQPKCLLCSAVSCHPIRHLAGGLLSTPGAVARSSRLA